MKDQQKREVHITDVLHVEATIDAVKLQYGVKDQQMLM